MLPGAGPQFKSTLSVKARSITAAERQRKVFGFSINVLIGTHPGIRGCRREKWRAKGNHMALPAILQGESVTRLLQGAAAGAVATLVIGFTWGGWVTGGTARVKAQKNCRTALRYALSSICVGNFQLRVRAGCNLIYF